MLVTKGGQVLGLALMQAPPHAPAVVWRRRPTLRVALRVFQAIPEPSVEASRQLPSTLLEPQLALRGGAPPLGAVLMQPLGLPHSSPAHEAQLRQKQARVQAEYRCCCLRPPLQHCYRRHQRRSRHC